jgi:hypothetical protein
MDCASGNHFAFSKRWCSSVNKTGREIAKWAADLVLQYQYCHFGTKPVLHLFQSDCHFDDKYPESDPI